MPEDTLKTCAYHIIRYQPNLVRDEWVNIGVLLFVPAEVGSGDSGHGDAAHGGPDDAPSGGSGEKAENAGGTAVKPSADPAGNLPPAGRVRQRWLEEPSDLARLRRLHPLVDEDLLLRLPAEFERQFAGREMEAGRILEKFDDTLSNAVQLAPRKGLLSRDPEAELDRLFHEQVEPVRELRRGVLEIRTRGDVRARAADYFRSEKILRLMQRGVRVEEYTAPGDPMRLDFSYRRNGTRGFVHSVALGRDPGQAKLLAYTAGAIRERVRHTEFLAVTEREPAASNARDRFVSEILRESDVRVVPLGELRKWAHEVAPVLRAEAS